MQRPEATRRTLLALTGLLAAGSMGACSGAGLMRSTSGTYRPAGLAVSAAVAEPPTDRLAWMHLVAGNARFAAGKPDPWPEPVRDRPLAGVLWCSDSAIPPARLFDTRPGALHGVASPGVTVDRSVVDQVEDVVRQHELRLVLVVGHTDCGAMKAAISRPRGSRPAATAKKPGEVLAQLTVSVRKTPGQADPRAFLTDCVATQALRAAYWLRNTSDLLDEGQARPERSRIDVVPVIHDRRTGLITRVRGR